MRIARTSAAALVTITALAAHASIPGNIRERAREGLQHVCVDSEPGAADYVECQLQEGGLVDAPYTAAECVAGGLPAECVLDFVPRVRVKGTVTIVHDELSRAGNSADAGEEVALILDLKVRRKKLRIFELYEGSKLGNWNTVGVESALLVGGIQIVDPGMTAYQFANDNLEDLGDRIVALVDPLFPKADLSDAVPVVTRLERVDKRTVDASGADPTATATVWKLTLEFVRVRN